MENKRHCKANNDGSCTWSECPQIRDGEPERSGRPCPIGSEREIAARPAVEASPFEPNWHDDRCGHNFVIRNCPYKNCEAKLATIELDEARAEIARLTQERDDFRDDYLRVHKDKCDLLDEKIGKITRSSDTIMGDTRIRHAGTIYSHSGPCDKVGCIMPTDDNCISPNTEVKNPIRNPSPPGRFADQMDWLHRVFSSQTITPLELRIAGLVALEWWLMDHIWFIGTVKGWW